LILKHHDCEYSSKFRTAFYLEFLFLTQDYRVWNKIFHPTWALWWHRVERILSMINVNLVYFHSKFAMFRTMGDVISQFFWMTIHNVMSSMLQQIVFFHLFFNLQGSEFFYSFIHFFTFFFNLFMIFMIFMCTFVYHGILKFTIHHQTQL
jgi:hypothetical protein